MQNFIVLGIIPGTKFQTTFNFWLGVAIVFVVLLSIPKYLRLAKRLYAYLVIRQIARTINHFELITY